MEEIEKILRKIFISLLVLILFVILIGGGILLKILLH